MDAAAAVAPGGARLLLRRRQRRQHRRLSSRTAACSDDALDGEAASAAAADDDDGPLFSRELGSARATSSLRHSDHKRKSSDNRLVPAPPSRPERERQPRNPAVLCRRSDFTSERSKSDLCSANGDGGLRDLVYRSSIRIMVRPGREGILVIQRSASENRVSNGSGGGAGGGPGGGSGGGGGGGDEVSANGANAEGNGGSGHKKSRKESIGLIQKAVARENVR